MAIPSARELTQLARAAGYRVADVEQLRANRWLLTVFDPADEATLVMAQARPLIGAADVQDLADLVQLRQIRRGILLACGGSFSLAAQRTLAELGSGRLRLCTSLPPAVKATPDAEPLAVVPALKRMS
jgi:hypothetical protein